MAATLTMPELNDADSMAADFARDGEGTLPPATNKKPKRTRKAKDGPASLDDAMPIDPPAAAAPAKSAAYTTDWVNVPIREACGVTIVIELRHYAEYDEEEHIAAGWYWGAKYNGALRDGTPKKRKAHVEVDEVNVSDDPAPTRTAAVAHALKYLAATYAGIDSRVVEDIEEFEAQFQSKCAGLLNHEHIEIEFRKKSKCTASVQVACADDGQWMMGFSWSCTKDVDGLGGTATPINAKNAATLLTRREAVCAGLQAIIEDMLEAGKHMDDARQDVQRLLDKDSILADNNTWGLPGVKVEDDRPEGEPSEADEQGEAAAVANAEQPHPAPAPEPLDYQSILADIEALEDEVAIAEREYRDAKEAAKEAREIYDGKVLDLRRAIRAAKNDQDRPLLNGVKHDDWSDDDQVRIKESVATATPDAWRLASLDVLGLPPKLAELLAENSVETIGQLEDLRAAPKGLRGVKGIGPAKVDLIEDAVIKWLSENRDGLPA